MSEGHPLKRLPRLLNPRKLAYQGASIEGLVDSKALQRLSEAADCSGDIRARLDFSVNESAKVILRGEVSAKLAHQCQRCMGMIPEREEQATLSIAVVRNEDEAKQLSRELDPWIVADEDGDIFTLLEEELLLAMPVAAYHDYECIDTVLYASGQEQATEAPARENPFKVLGSLKKS